MRKDMAKLIVKGPPVPKDRSNHTKSRLNFEDAPEREGMRAHHGWREGPRDHLNPLRHYLKSNVGRRWDEVFKEICKVADSRSFEGKHLLEHIEQMVIPESELVAILSHRYNWRRHYWGFYEDSNGILRLHDDYRKYKYRPQHNPDECVIDNKPYCRINNCWFEASYHEVQEPRTELDFMTCKTVVRYYAKTVIRKVRQLNTKELKALGLSNEPGWKWYERTK